MKRMILTALGFVPIAVLAQSSNFNIKGKVGHDGAPAKTYLVYRSGGKVMSDSVVVDKGNFRFSGMVTGPVNAQLIMDHKGEGLVNLGRGADVISIYLEKGDISITAKDSVKNALITGSKLNDDNVKYKTLTKASDKAMAKVNTDFNAASDEQKNAQGFINLLKARLIKAQEEKKTIQQQFIKQNPESYISLLALMEVAGEDMDVSVMEPLYKSLSANLRSTTEGHAFAKAIETAHATSVGAMAPLFTQNDVNNKRVSLVGFRGKYVLLDFWASWCGPCRSENPNVVKAYNQYKNKNFTVLGVSLDRPGKKEDWLAAIKADGLAWTQVSDLKFWNNEVAQQYGIRGIPQNYLIDPAGKIIAKNLRGDELNKKLASLFN